MADSHNTQGQYLRLKPTSLIKGIRKEPDYEKSSQQKQIRQAAIILVSHFNPFTTTMSLESDQKNSEV